MIRIYESGEISVEEILKSDKKSSLEVYEAVRTIIDDVKTRGDAALYDYSEKFDGIKPESLAVSEREIEESVNSVDRFFLKTLETAKENIADFHKRQKRENYTVNEREGIILGQRVLPIEKVGIYVPGGTANYPSSVLMNVIPAVIAGVSEVIMVTPCGKNGKIADVILAAAKTAGVSKIFKIGGAQAIAALAYGTESVPKVDKITGPGNIYVAEAKRMVYGTVDIDMAAGPSDILVIADKTCDARFIAADMLAQAEHDKMSAAILVTDSRELAEKVSGEIEKQLGEIDRKDIAEASIKNNGKIIIVSDMKEAVSVSNAIAPEHLEICIDDPFSILNDIKNAGCVFLGKNVPEAVGDYIAGTNHVLPTGGAARFAGPLSVDDFTKKSNFVYYTKKALAEAEGSIVDFAEKEGLFAHGKSVSIRFEGKEKR
jgi:histidinol dehydrogenase